MRATRRSLVAFATALLIVSTAGCGQPAESIDLAAGLRLERSVTAGRSHRFAFTAAANRYLHLGIEQQGLDVVVVLSDPSGHTLFEVDSPIGDTGWERVTVVTPAAGEYRLEVRPLAEQAAGSFAFEVFEVREAGGEDRLRCESAAALASAERRRTAGDFRPAAELYARALPGLAALGDTAEAARAKWRLGQALVETGETVEAQARLEEAAADFRGLGDAVGEARALLDLGVLLRKLGELRRAEAAHRRSLALYRQAGNDTGQGSALNNLGLVAETAGDLSTAADLYESSLEVWRRLGRRKAEAATLQNIGSLYALIGRDEEALELLQQAVGLFEAEGDERKLVSALMELGWANYLAGRLELALERYDAALALAARLGDRLGEGAVADRQGTAYRALGRFDDAARSYRKALAVFRESGRRLSEGHTLANLGWLELTTAPPETAQRRLDEALAILAEVGDPNAEVYALVGLARADRRLGDLVSARRHLEKAVGLIEGLRTGAGGALSRGTYLATRYDAYEGLVTLLMELHRRQPDQGYERTALETVERARARVLLEELPAAESEAKPAPLGAGEMQALLGDDTRLLVYFLAEPESFLWTLDRHGLEAHRLPGKSVIEERARRVASALPRSAEVAFSEQAAAALAALSEAILEPWYSSGDDHLRWAVEADGVLHYVPFAALPARAEGGEPLLARHEIVRLPSASVLAYQRRTLAERSPPRGTLAVVADPVFGANDERLSGVKPAAAVLPQDLERAVKVFDPSTLERLPYAATEADAILGLVPEASRFSARGFEARRELVESGVLGEYRIVHFATHALLNPVHPELSGLMLSLVDAEGRPRDGFLRAHEVAQLHLAADLVVLSACSTGLGREVRGEGLVGLSQAFFQAGARRVIVSSWNVNDLATAELMADFYRHLLAGSESPAAALREAQLAMRASGKRGAPYYWAAFSLQGDWR